MTDTKWPKCQPNLKVCTRISVPESTVRFPGTDDPDAGVWSRQVTVSDAHRERPGHVNYTRTDIAEARIAELEGTLRKIAGIVHYGGLMGYDSEGNALIEVRRLSQKWVDSDECTRLQIERDPVLCASLGFHHDCGEH